MEQYPSQRLSARRVRIVGDHGVKLFLRCRPVLAQFRQRCQAHPRLLDQVLLLRRILLGRCQGKGPFQEQPGFGKRLASQRHLPQEKVRHSRPGLIDDRALEDGAGLGGLIAVGEPLGENQVARWTVRDGF